MKKFILILLLPVHLFAQEKNIDYFLNAGIKNNPQLLENTNLQKSFLLQNELITAQNKKPQINFTSDFLFAPFFANDGHPISITSAPAEKAFGYDAGLTNGGLYSAQFNVSIPLFNSVAIKNLYEQNKLQAKISSYSRRQIEHDIAKTIIDQYIITYQFSQQAFYLKKIIEQLQSRKPMVEALVIKGLLQQNDFLLLDIQITTNSNDLKQLQFGYNNGIAILKNLALMSDTNNYVLVHPFIEITENPTAFNFVEKYKLDSLNIIAQQNVFNSRYRPQVSAFGNTGINATDIANVPHNVGLSAGLHLLIPIRDGGQRKINEKQNDILLANQKIYLSNEKLLKQNNLRNAKLQIDQLRQTIAMANEPIQKQELLLDIIKDKVVKGQVTVMDYINALQDYKLLQKNKALAETSLLLYINQYNYYNW